MIRDKENKKKGRLSSSFDIAGSYKETINLPQTNFIAHVDKKIWVEIYENSLNLFEEINRRKREQKKDVFILHDGPPYANGSIHLGHALNKILKDFVIRRKLLEGYRVDYVPGWDAHGIPIELECWKKYGRQSKGDDNFLDLCKEYALENVEIQKNQFKKLGLLHNFNNYYLTLSDEYVKKELDLLVLIAKKGYLYHGLRPQLYSIKNQSVVSEVEVEYKEKISSSLYVMVKINLSLSSFIKRVDDYEVFLLVWTTTPWTLVANQLIAVNEQVCYSLCRLFYRRKGKKKEEIRYVIAKKDFIFFLKKSVGLSDFFLDIVIDKIEVIQERVEIKQLIGCSYQGILKKKFDLQEEGKIVNSQYVDKESGTAIMHVAPGFGKEDFLIGRENDIKKPIVHIDKWGSLDLEYALRCGEIFSDYAKNKSVVSYHQLNQRVIDYVTDAGIGMLSVPIKHRYPFDARTNEELIYMATEQWFLRVLGDIQRDVEKNVDRIRWIPSFRKKSMREVTRARDSDWCISRQRRWGVMFLEKVVASLKSTHHSKRCDKKKGELLDRKDILDVWFDSSVSHLIVHEGKQVDLVVEGKDQLRGWFGSSLTVNALLSHEKDVLPFKEVLVHGFVLDEKGIKMSKSAGNIIDPLLICDTYNPEILRLSFALSDYLRDIRIGHSYLNQVKGIHFRIRNAIKFIVGNLYDFEVKKNDFDWFAGVSIQSDIDLFMVCRIWELKKLIDGFYAEFNFKALTHLLVDYINNDLSSFYFEYSKDILYIEAKRSVRRKQVQCVYYFILNFLIWWIMPILPYTSDEISRSFSFSNFQKSAFKSFYFEDWRIIFSFLPKMLGSSTQKITNRFKKLLKFRQDVFRVLEEEKKKKNITNPLQFEIFILPIPDYIEIINIKDAHRFFLVSRVVFIEKKEDFFKNAEVISKPNFSIQVRKHSGIRCKRCWLYFHQSSDSVIEMCARCIDVLKSESDVNQVEIAV